MKNSRKATVHNQLLLTMNRTFIFTLLLTMFSSTVQAATNDTGIQAPVITKGLSNSTMYYKEDSIVTLECEADGEPRPEFEWTFNGAKTFDGCRKYTFHFTKDRRGQYQCWAKNRYGTDFSLVTTLKFAGLKAVGVRQQETQSGNIGTHMNLTAQGVIGVPSFTCTWVVTSASTSSTTMQDPIYPPLLESKRILIGPRGIVYFANLEREDDGTYMCFATNPSFGNDSLESAKIKLDISDPVGAGTNPVPASIQLICCETEYTVTVGEPMKISCLYTGWPSVHVEWDLLLTTSFKINKTLEHTITSKGVSSDDEGTFVCRGCQENNTDCMTTRIKLTVKRLPTITGPLIVSKTIQGDSNEFKCNADFDKVLDIQWYINGQLFTSRAGWSLSNDRKTLKSPSLNFGETYSIACKASGDEKSAIASASVVGNDLDECATTDKNDCGDICVNTPGSYKCECSGGYVVSSDGKSCSAVLGAGGVFAIVLALMVAMAIPVLVYLYFKKKKNDDMNSARGSALTATSAGHQASSARPMARQATPTVKLPPPTPSKQPTPMPSKAPTPLPSNPTSPPQQPTSSVPNSSTHITKSDIPISSGASSVSAKPSGGTLPSQSQTHTQI